VILKEEVEMEYRFAFNESQVFSLSLIPFQESIPSREQSLRACGARIGFGDWLPFALRAVFSWAV